MTDTNLDLACEAKLVETISSITTAMMQAKADINTTPEIVSALLSVLANTLAILPPHLRDDTAFKVFDIELRQRTEAAARAPQCGHCGRLAS